MRNAIAIGILGLALVSNRAAAQTVVEQAQILRDFQQHVVDYTQRHQSRDMWPEAINAATPAPKVFTLPVAVVFRQLIATAVAGRSSGATIGGVGTTHHPTVLQPFPATELYDFPPVLGDALPRLPAPLEYRLIDNDLVIRDANADVIVAVLRDALGTLTTRQ
jgi:hypothetical protein